jgi:hypothetical protein
MCLLVHDSDAARQKLGTGFGTRCNWWHVHDVQVLGRMSKLPDAPEAKKVGSST